MFFDDFKGEHVKGPVVQMDDYYPFGLTFNSYKRENSVENKIKFQGQEHIDDLNLGWDSFKWRNHQPDIGRFFNVDPLAEKYVYNSPYAFSENKVVAHIELEGLESVPFGPGTNPGIAVLESFRRVGNAIVSLFSVEGKAYVTTTGNEKKASLGGTTVSSKTSMETSASVKIGFSGLLDYHGNNEYVAPKMVTTEVKTEISQTTEVKTTATVSGVPVNVSASNTMNATTQQQMDKVEVSVGVNEGTVQGKAFVSNSTTTNMDGSQLNNTNIGVKVETPVYNDGQRKVSVGLQGQIIIQ